MAYVDYTYYSLSYLLGKQASIAETEFPYYAMKATKKIDQYTFNNIDSTNIPESVKMCCCELAESFYNQDSNSNTNVASERVGEYSVSYVTGQAVEDAKKAVIKEIIYNWLSDTGLLYRGC
ncbi:head-tail connector protein [Anaerosacchariphilus polymeriproducens]|uniref:DUF3199 family protein n=1 Tax=Anaerosacchariphilus polymeriproducens TaxID=1812858 RepID=A0A371AQT0_9FIRM|nr:DUF3199 family protein [Anaerosacchariphilus polymeriproducens]RDU21935.1 DUF3199 family protein [Anaerosacchariphilus polymeriproducens]